MTQEEAGSRKESKQQPAEVEQRCQALPFKLDPLGSLGKDQTCADTLVG